MAYDEVPIEGPRYRAFISYSHADARFATWLHRRLENWKLPDGARLAPIFIDRAELPAGPDLPAQVRSALERSDVLIVVASPAARASQWVAQEIALFRDHYPDRPILTALIDGEPALAFPQPLVEHRGKVHEPLAADFRKGHDGRQLGLLKIVAGLSGLPLDQLVQRDALARQRRVMAVTAATALLVLVLGVLLVFALRARAEAERQRAEAEGMVEFMLTDLRDRLKGVGRLDIMDAVNERAMAHYEDEVDLSRLPPDALLRRAKLLQAMGADEIERAGSDPAMAEVRERGAKFQREAWRETRHLLDEKPDDPERIFVHAQSEYYVGNNYLIEPGKSLKERSIAAKPNFLAYRDLALKLVRIDPNNLSWQREVGFAEGNMCATHLAIMDAPKAMLQACANATAAMERIWKTDPDGLMPILELANRYAWEADAHLALGDKERAIALRRKQLELTGRATRLHPRDMQATMVEMLARLGMAQLLHKLARWSEAKVEIDKAMQIATTMRLADPENGDWKGRQTQIADLAAKIARKEK